jgi:bifunctional non-homologous end joining protein LigD
MGLDEYQRKRDFRKTPEPRGKAAAKTETKLAFVIQKHDASHLHYDFRLELDGVLKSWAVPKGPDLDPANKRLAMQVEDHPLEYGGFEGTIPEGEYGGGTVMLWDRGVWEPSGDPVRGLKEGHLKFVLHGEKLRGGWMLVRKGGRSAAEDERRWFLFKERDKFARPGASITDELPLSVETGRDLEEIAAESDRAWGANGDVSHARRTNGRSHRGSSKSTRRSTANAQAVKGVAKRRRTAANGRPKRAATGGSKADLARLQTLLEVPGVRRGKLPARQSVELATLAEEAPSGSEWLHEVKFDGYRMLCRVDGGKARFISRNGLDWTEKLPELAAAAGRLPVEQAMLDGEVVSLKPDGTTSFQALQNVFQAGRTRELVYYAFDILHVNGRNVTGAPLEDRREILRLVLSDGLDSIRLSESIQGSGGEIIDKACQLHLEGIVSKRADSIYRPGRTLDWLKVKCSQREEFVIGGFTKPRGTRSHFGALLLGHFDQDGKLIYAGRVGTGFDEATLAELHRRLTRLVMPRPPFADHAAAVSDARDVAWVMPALVAEIQFSNWTDDGLLRHATFQGLREDKPASTVIHHEPLLPSEVKELANGEPQARAPQRKKRRTTAVSAGPRPAERATANGNVAGVHLSHPDKVLYPGQGITKRDLADYYANVAEWMLPHVVDRPLAIVRCPAGSGKPCFFQKHPGEGASDHLKKVNVSQTKTPEYHQAIQDTAGLVALVQMGVLEIHVWGSREGRLEKPDRLVFDLDPDPSVDWPQVVRAARLMRALLEELGLVSYLKTTGGKGLHLVVPVQPRTEWDEAKAFCRAVAELMVRAEPDRFVATMSKSARKGKIFIDYLRNARGAIAVAAYSTRAKPGATVSTPIGWDELTPSLRSDHFTIENVPARLRQLKKDPWGELAKTKQSITAAMRKRVGLD